MLLFAIAIVACGLFAGAAIYINLVEHPARVQCGTATAVREFAPSYARATIMQASLAIVGCLGGVVAGWQRSDMPVVFAAVLLGLVVPFTVIVIRPTNLKLLDPSLNASSPEAAALLARWTRLHAVRSILALIAFLVLVIRAAGGVGD